MKNKRNILILIAGIVVIGVAFLAISLYQFKTVTTYLQEESYVVGSDDLLKTLQSGKKPDKMTYDLSKVSEGSPIYSRNKSLFYGEGKNKIEAAFPFYTNNENAMMFMNDASVLIDEDYESLSTFKGMYVSDGYSFNYDKTQADDQKINFVKLSNGLFINARALTFSYPGGETTVGMNGIFMFKEDGVTFYQVGPDHTLVYGELPTVSLMTVTFGDKTISYEQMLLLLGITSIKEDPKKDETQTEEETEVESGEDFIPESTEETYEYPPSEMGYGDESSVPGHVTETDVKGTTKETTSDTEKNTASESSKENQTADANAGDETAESDKNQDESASSKEEESSTDEKEESSEGNNDADEDDDAEESSGSGNKNPDSGADVPGGEGEGEQGNNGSDIPYQVPVATIGKFIPDVYNVATTLQVKDPSGVMKRMVIELYWQEENEDGTPKENSNNKNNYKLMYRRTYRNDGDIIIDNLPPGTTIYARALIYYYEKGRTVNTVFYDSFEDRFQTLSLDHVDDLYVQMEDSDMDTPLLPHAINIHNLVVSGPNKNVVDKVSKVRINLTAVEGKAKGQEFTVMMGMTELRKTHFYPEDLENIPVWTSDSKAVFLPSDTEFTYTIELLDPFGTPFSHVVNGYMENKAPEESASLIQFEKSNNYFTPSGTTHTARITPTVSFASSSFGDGKKNIDRAAYMINVTDPDNSMDSTFTDGTYDDSCFVRIFMEDGENPDVPVMFATEENGEKMDRLPLSEATVNGEQTKYTFWNLTAGHVYRMEVVGNYDLNDGNPDGYYGYVLGTTRFSTIPMSSYGRVSYKLSTDHIKTDSIYESATAQQLGIRIDYTLTMTDLVSLYFNKVNVVLSEVEGSTVGKTVLNADITRSALESIGDLSCDSESAGMVMIPVDFNMLFPSGTVYEKNTDNGLNPSCYIYVERFEGEKSAWELFQDYNLNATIVITYGEGTLHSMTSHTINTVTTAMQGGEYHDVTSRSNSAKRTSFTTLKKMPYVTYDDALLVSDRLVFYGVQLHDVDHAIVDDIVNSGVIGYDVREYQLSRTEQIPGGILLENGDHKLTYSDLQKGVSYTYNVTPSLIKRSVNSSEYALRDEVLLSYDFVAGSGLFGKVSFESIGYPLVVETKEGEEPAVELQSKYNLYNAANFTCDSTYLATDGTFKDTSIMSTSVWALSPAIPVTGGKYYYITGMRVNETDSSFIAFYDAQDKPLKTSASDFGSNGTIRFRTLRDALIKAPAGASYMRFNMNGSTGGITTYATASCYAMTDAEAIEETGYKADQIIPVEEGAKYAIADYIGRYSATFYKDEALTEEVANSMSVAVANDSIGTTFTAPQGAKYLKISEATNSSASRRAAASVVKVIASRLDWLLTADMSHFANSISVVVKDPNNNLIKPESQEVHLTVSKKVDNAFVEMTGDDNPIDEKLMLQILSDGSAVKTADFEKVLSFLADANQTFKLDLYVTYKGENIVLDSVEFKTNRVLEVIHNRTEVAKMMRYPYGDFLVVDDIHMRDNEYGYTGSTSPFQGTVDFQGYTLKETRRNSSYFIHTMGTSGTIKNMLLDLTVDNASTRLPLNYVRGLIYDNYGTVQDSVVKLNLGQGMYRKNHVSSLAENHYGIIENVCLVYAANSTNYVGTYFGGLVRSNNSTIRNIFVYCPGTVNVTTGVYGGSQEISNHYAGLIAASNGGTIDKAIVIGSIAVEDYQSNGALNYQSLISGTQGNIRNSVGVGEMLKVEWVSEGAGSSMKTRTANIYTGYGPLVPSSLNANTAGLSNNFFYSVSPEKFKYQFINRQQKISEIAMLQDASFYDTTINLDGEFITSDVDAGYYPRLNLIEKLLKQEPKVPLASAGVDNSIRYLNATINEQYEVGDLLPDGTRATEDFAIVTMKFYNRLSRPINAIDINGLNVLPVGDRDSFEQYSDKGNYYVKVKITPNGLYRNQYEIRQFTYNDTYTSDVIDRNLVLTFSKLITQENWIDENGVSGFDDLAGYYRLGSDIDYNYWTDATLKARAEAALVSNTAFSGELDGRNYTVKNFKLATSPYFIKTLTGGSLKDIVFDNISINNQNAKYGYIGIVGQASADAKADGVVIKNMQLNGIYNFGGALFARSERATIKNTVVSGLTATSHANGTGLYVGGLTGYTTYTKIDNCFAKGLNLDISAGSTAEGIGGLVGYSTSYSAVSNCYAEGSLKSSFIYTGGLVGYNNAIAVNNWTKVNITSTAPYIGGITGVMNNSSSVTQVLAVGDVFTTASDNYGRINGGYIGQTVNYTKAYAASIQKVNSVKSSELYGASGLMTVADLKTEQMYWNYINLGEQFKYQGIVENGFMPKLYRMNEEVLLPCQSDDESIPITSTAIEFDAEGVAVFNEREYSQNGTNEYTLTATLTFYSDDMKKAIKPTDASQVSQTAVSQYFDKKYTDEQGNAIVVPFGNISIANMELPSDPGLYSISTGMEEVSVELDDGSVQVKNMGVTYVTFPVNTTHYFDSYQAEYTYLGNTTISKLRFMDESLSKTEFSPLYHHIYYAYSEKHDKNVALSATLPLASYDLRSWQDATALYGLNYENYLLMADIDFSGVANTKSALKANLRVGRLEGYKNRSEAVAEAGVTEKERREYLLSKGEYQLADDTESYYTRFSNLSYTDTNTASVAFIYELQTAVRFVNFEDNSWSATGTDASYIRKLSGNIRFVDLHGNALDYNKGSGYAAFVSRQTGEIEYVRVYDMKVYSSQPVASTSVSYVAGLSAYATGKLTHIYAEGTKTDDKYNYSISGSVLSTSNSGNYTGGIVGYSNNSETDYLYANRLSVTGNQYVGTVAGYTYGYSINAANALWQKHQTARYNSDQTGLSAEELPVYAMAAINSEVTGRNYVGGIGGSLNYFRYGYSANNKVHATGERAGGICAAGGGTYFTVIGCEVTSDGIYAGGAVAAPSGYGLTYSRIVGTTVYALRDAGGLLGIYTGDNSKEYVTVSACAVYAEENAGGLAGLEDANSYASRRFGYDLVNQGTIVGGINGKKPVVHRGENPVEYTLDTKDTNTYSVTLEESSGTLATKNAGGMAGVSHGISYYYDVVDDSVRVVGDENVGGCFGYGGGGKSYNNEFGASVEAVSGFAGSFAGQLNGYDVSSKGPNLLQLPVTKLERTILAGTVKASSGNAGGLAGSFSPGSRPIDPETGAEISDEISGYSPTMSSNAFTRILFAETSIQGGSSTTGVFTGNKTISTYGVGYARIYKGMSINGSTDVAIDILNSSAGQNNIISGWNGKDTDKSNAPDKPFFVQVIKDADGNVTRNDLANPALYYGALADYGLYLSQTANKASSASHFYYFDTRGANGALEAGVLTAKGIFPYVTTAGNRTLVGAWMGLDGTDSYGATYADHVQDGILIPPASYEFADSISTQEAPTRMFARFLRMAPKEEEGFDPELIYKDVSIYSSGIDTVNFEVPKALQENFTDATISILNASGNVIVDAMKLDSRVVTIPYDYRSTITVVLTLKDGEEKSYAVTPDLVRKTIMTYGTHAWYLRNDGVFMDQGSMESYDESLPVNSVVALPGSFVHLYQGYALSSAGQIYRVDSKSVVSSIDTASLFVPTNSTAAYVTEFSGSTVRAYRMYSDTPGGTNEFRMIAKNGKLFSMDPMMDEVLGQRFTSFVVDYYSTSQANLEYMSVLDETGVLSDYMTPLTWPMTESGKEVLKNKQIAEVADNVYASVPYALIRYTDNTTACFNYQTGSLIFRDTEEQTKLSFTEYASTWVASLGSNLQVRNAYLSANAFVNTLTENPISDDELVGYINLDAPSVGQSNETEDGVIAAIDGDSKKDNETANGGGENIKSGTNDELVSDGKTESGVSHTESEGSEFVSDEKNESSDRENEGVSSETEKKEGENSSVNETSEISGTKEETESGSNTENVETTGESSDTSENGKEEVNSGTVNTEGTAPGDGTETESEGMGHASSDGTGSGNENAASKSDGGKDMITNTYPSVTDPSAYVTVITGGVNGQKGYEVYKAEDMLTRSGASLLSENAKLQILKKNGVRSDINLDDMKLTAKENRTGLLLILGASAVILMLLVILFIKKRKMDRK